MRYGLALCVIVPLLGIFLCYLVALEQSRAVVVPGGTESALAGESQYLSLKQHVIRAKTCYASGIDIRVSQKTKSPNFVSQRNPLVFIG